MDHQQQKRPREDALAPASKRPKLSFPLFLGGVQPYWYKDNRGRAEAAAAAYLRDRTNHDDVTVRLDVPAYGQGFPTGTAWFLGHGDAHQAALRALGKRDAIDAGSRNRNKTVMFKEVKEHNGFEEAVRRLREAEARAAAPAPDDLDAAMAAFDGPAAAPAGLVAARPPAVAPPPPAPALVPTSVAWPEEVWRRALAASRARPIIDVLAFGRPLIHNALDVARAQIDRDKDGRCIWAFDLPPLAGSGGAPKRWLVASPAEFDAAYACVPAVRRQTYEVIDARRPCWAYFDLEFTRKDGLNAAVDGELLLRRVVSAACDALLAAAGDRALDVEVVVLASERPTKFSRHVVLRPHWTGGGRRPAPLAGSQHAGALAAVVVKALGEALTVQSGDSRTTTSFVDTGVYTRDRCFRVWGSTKHGDDAGAAFAVRDRWLLPCFRPAGPFLPSPLRETLVVLHRPLDSDDCLEISAPVEPPPPPSPGAVASAADQAAAPAAPADEGSWEVSWAGATATPLLDAQALPHPYIHASASGRGAPPAPFAVAAAEALAALRRDRRDNGVVAPMSWRYVAADYPSASERYLHLSVPGRGVFCRSRGRPHANQNLVVTIDPRNGRCWQRCFDSADCARNVPTTAGGVCRISNRHELAASDDLKVDYRVLLAFEKDMCK